MKNVNHKVNLVDNSLKPLYNIHILITEAFMMNNKLLNMILIGMFAALMAVGAYLKIPTPYVPITFQLFFAVFAGLLLKPASALMSQVIYLLIGLIGIPVFSNGGGFSYIFNPTFGYIIGFALTAFIIALMISKLLEITLNRVLVISLIGYSATYIIGNLYFYMIMNLVVGKTMGLMSVFGIMVPYMIKDFILLIIAAMAATSVIPVLRRSGYVRGN